MLKWPFMLAWSFIITIIACHRVTESSESEEGSQNTTTLYPVTEAVKNATEEQKDKNENLKETTTWKIEAAFAESKLPEIHKDNHTDSIWTVKESKEANESKDAKESKEAKEEKPVNCTKEFRPSPPLGILEDDTLPSRGAHDNFVPLRQPASGFHSSRQAPFKSGLYSPPKDIFRQNDFPYKIENTIFTRAKGGWSTLDSKPTVEAPVRVPAGGLYQSPDAFKEKPGGDSDDDNFGLDFNRDVKGGKDTSSQEIKKRINPWKNLLRLVTAFIPVGLIISALTPSVITIEDTGPDSNYNRYPSTLLRRSTSSGLGTISEPCRRRLLCELHSERNYGPGDSPRRRGKHCYKLHCEDTEALARALRWLLAYHQTNNDIRERLHY